MLAVYPLLDAGAIRWFDSRSLTKEARAFIEGKQFFFKTFKSTRMLEWSLERKRTRSSAE